MKDLVMHLLTLDTKDPDPCDVLASNENKRKKRSYFYTSLAGIVTPSPVLSVFEQPVAFWQYYNMFLIVLLWLRLGPAMSFTHGADIWFPDAFSVL